MKRLLLTLPVLLLLIGCTTVFTSIVTITQVRDQALKDWAAASASNKSTPAVDSAVIAADAKFRAAAAVAEKALIAYKSSGNQADYLAAMIAVRASVSDLLALIAPVISGSEAQALQVNLSKATKL